MEELGGVETEHAHVAEVADGPPPDGHTESVRRVVDERQFVAAGDVRQRIEFAGETVDVDGEDRRGPGSDGSLHRRGVQGEVIRLDVDEYGAYLVPVQRVGSGHESERGRDDFPRNVHALETDLERKGAVVEKADVVRLEVSAQLPAETLDDRAVVREPVIAPYFFQPILEFFQGREIGSRHQDGLVERLGRHFQISGNVIVGPIVLGHPLRINCIPTPTWRLIYHQSLCFLNKFLHDQAV